VWLCCTEGGAYTTCSFAVRPHDQPGREGLAAKLGWGGVLIEQQQACGTLMTNNVSA